VSDDELTPVRLAAEVARKHHLAGYRVPPRGEEDAPRARMVLLCSCELEFDTSRTFSAHVARHTLLEQRVHLH
jgi:hypothetical protein